MYIKKVYDLGVVIQVEKYYPGNYGAPGVKREKKRKCTPEDIKRQNETNRWKKLQRIILANFKAGDWHLILKYGKKKPEQYKEAVDQRREFIKEMRKAYKKADIPFKWIAVTERGKRGRVLHHHLVIQDITEAGIITVQLVKKLWTYGNAFFVSLYEDGEYEKLAEYIVKAETKEESGWCTYSRSRNMIVPQPEREKIHRRKWANPPRAPKGWYILKETVHNGTNPVTGHPYQHYSIRKLEGGAGDG